MVYETSGPHSVLASLELLQLSSEAELLEEETNVVSLVALGGRVIVPTGNVVNNYI
jgi:hypothetical protein